MKPVLVPPSGIRPLPLDVRGVACTRCERPQSLWELTPGGESNAEFICSACWLRERCQDPSEREHVFAIISAVEKKLEAEMPRDTDGIPLNIEDADRLVASFVLTSRVFNLRSRVA